MVSTDVRGYSLLKIDKSVQYFASLGGTILRNQSKFHPITRVRHDTVDFIKTGRVVNKSITIHIPPGYFEAPEEFHNKAK